MTPKAQETIGSNVANRPVWVGPLEPSPLLALSKAWSNELAKDGWKKTENSTRNNRFNLLGPRSSTEGKKLWHEEYPVEDIYIFMYSIHILGKLMFSTKVAWEA